MRGVHELLVDRHGNAIATVFGGKYKSLCDSMLSVEQWHAVRQLLDILGPFRWLIRIAQGENYSTLAVTWANLFGALHLLRQPTINAAIGVNKFKAAFLEEIEKRFCDPVKVPSSAMIAVGLDPRYHNTDVFASYPELAAHQERCLTNAIQALLDFHRPPMLPAKVVVQHLMQERECEREVENSDDVAHARTMVSIQRRGTNALLEGVSRLPQRAAVQIQVTAQTLLEDYRAQPGLAATSPQREVLLWFRSKQHITSLNHLFRLASMYIFVPSTTAPSERIGSTAGQVYSKRRLSLAPSVAEYVVVLHESKRRVARKIVDSSPSEIMAEIESAFIREHILSDNDEPSRQGDNEDTDEADASDEDDDDDL